MQIVLLTRASDLGRLVAQLAHNHGLALRVALGSDDLAGRPCDLVLVDVEGNAGDFAAVRLAAPRAAVWALGNPPAGAFVDRVFPSPPSLLDLLDALRTAAERSPAPRADEVHPPPEPARTWPTSRPEPTRVSPRPEATGVPAATSARATPAGAREHLRMPAAERTVPPPVDPGTVKLVATLWDEVERLERANPWMVLGLPPGSPARLARAMADRFQARYGELAHHTDPKVREAAGRLLGSVARARSELAHRLVENPQDGLADALHFLDRQQFGEAHRRLEALLADHPGLPGVRAHLAWARYHDPDLPRGDREAGATALLEEIVGGDPHLSIGWYYLGAIALLRGDLPHARDCAAQACRLDPSHPGTRDLLKRIG